MEITLGRMKESLDDAESTLEMFREEKSELESVLSNLREEWDVKVESSIKTRPDGEVDIDIAVNCYADEYIQIPQKVASMAHGDVSYKHNKATGKTVMRFGYGLKAFTHETPGSISELMF